MENDFNNFTDMELAQEQWRDIFGYDGMYQVSDLGRVRSHKSGEWKVMKQGKTTLNYLQVCLYKNGKGKHLYVHRLVADAFIPNDDETKTIINHINEIPYQNFVNNLEWCTQQYNTNYNDVQFRKKNIKRRKIKDLYNPELTVSKNISLLKEQGIEVSRNTVIRLRKDLGLIKHYRPRKQK